MSFRKKFGGTAILVGMMWVAVAGAASMDEKKEAVQNEKLALAIRQSAAYMDEIPRQGWISRPRLEKGSVNFIGKFKEKIKKNFWYIDGIWRPNKFMSNEPLSTTGLISSGKGAKLAQVSAEEVNFSNRTVVIAAPGAFRGEPSFWGYVIYFDGSGSSYTIYGRGLPHEKINKKLCTAIPDEADGMEGVCFRLYKDEKGFGYLETEGFQGHVSRLIVFADGDVFNLREISRFLDEKHKALVFDDARGRHIEGVKMMEGSLK